MGNIILRNISVGGRFVNITAGAAPYITMFDNLVDQDPRFVNREGLNFQLKDDSPAYNLGFDRIPIEKIGRYAVQETRVLAPPSEVRLWLR